MEETSNGKAVVIATTKIDIFKQITTEVMTRKEYK